MKEVTQDEKRAFLIFWGEQRKAIEGRVSEDTMRWFCIYTAAKNVGYEVGQLRPGKDGQWDLYSWLTDPEINCDKNEALIASGLTAGEVAEEERREQLRQKFVDPDNPREVADHERMERMTPEELSAEIARLEKELDAA